jgi:hypothetical protein
MLFPGLKHGLLGSKSRITETKGECLNQSSRVTRQEAIDEAVRRYRRQRPLLVELCLNPSHEKVRQQVVDWVRTEYQRIIAEENVAA